ncbi:MAG: transcription elongation factor GreA [Bacteroidetes bacterium]|nr:transcription elongation factor GreA [Bacteroidota bacterium]
MATELNYVTKEGMDSLRKELEHLKKVERPGISKQIAEARDKGDLSENAEYDAAKDAQGLLEAKIAKLENLIAHSRIIDESKLDSSKISLLSKVTVKNLKINKEMVYTIVSESEANLKEGKISSKSAIGAGLLGKEKGDIVEITVPAGIVKFEIINIQR